VRGVSRRLYVKTSGLLYGGVALYGLFAHLDFVLDTGAAELRLLFNGEGVLDPLGLPL
jgi:hypothetical protein